MVLTNDTELMARVALYRDHGMSKDRRYWHLVPGFNYRMTNIQAALGLAQMECIENFLSQRAKVVALYNERLKKIPGLLIPRTESWARNIHWLYTVEVDADVLGMTRDQFAARLQALGVETRPGFPALHNQPAYGGNQDIFPFRTGSQSAR